MDNIILSKDEMRQEAVKSVCKVIKFSASDGKIFSHNGEFFANCENCKRTEIEQSYPQCTANHAEWGLLAKLKNKDLSTYSAKADKCCKKIFIYCMTPEGEDYPFKRFWCMTCSMLIPMFGIKDVFMWDGNWIHHDANKLIEEVNLIKK